MRQGRKYVTVVVGNKKVEIRISPNSNDGPFFTEVDGKHYQGAGVEEIIRQIKKDQDAEFDLLYDPLIMISTSSSRGDSGFRILRYYVTRLLKAVHPHRGTLYYLVLDARTDQINYPHMTETPPLKPGPSTHGPYNDDIVIPYTPERWRALLHILEKCRETEENVKNIIGNTALGHKLDAIFYDLTEKRKEVKLS